jgi:pimeloyl-ACP methyl ester carboxylesterase
VSTYVLIHGSWHGGWCWYKVVAALERDGHRVLAPDLPSLGIDKTPVADVSLRTWTESVGRIVAAQTDPVVLVGHSRGGVVVSEVAEAMPEKVAMLVYVCAFLLRDGESLLQAAQEDRTSVLLGHLVPSDDQKSATVREDVIRDAFYGECSDDDVALAGSLLAPEAMAPFSTPLHLTAERFGSVRRVYIECLRDRAVPPALQKRMYTAQPCERVITIDTDHSPFFSAPDELVRHLLALKP